MTNIRFFPKLATYIDGLIQEADRIPDERKALLNKLAAYLREKQTDGMPAALTFICTHNSRRSHIGQIWATAAVAWYDLDFVTAFSGGTEATAFNQRAADALARAGFRIKNPGGDNPHYSVSFSEDAQSLSCFSKTFDDPSNPKKGFAAVMTCSEADENCPYIPGAELRLPLTYRDPKEADGTLEETVRYDERVRQIGREIFYALHLAAQAQP